MGEFNISITPKGIILKILNTEKELDLNFPYENDVLEESIQLCLETVKTLKNSLIESNIISFSPNHIMIHN